MMDNNRCSHADDLLWQADHPQPSTHAFRYVWRVRHALPGAMSVIEKAIDGLIQDGCKESDILDDIDFFIFPTNHAISFLHRIMSELGDCRVAEPGTFRFFADGFSVWVNVGPDLTQAWLEMNRQAA